jgi:hypothetical protein
MPIKFCCNIGIYIFKNCNLIQVTCVLGEHSRAVEMDPFVIITNYHRWACTTVQVCGNDVDMT